MILSDHRPPGCRRTMFRKRQRGEIFMRTSPTNIGLSMLATVAANDFGYITIDDLVERNLRTLETVRSARAFRRPSF